MTGVRLVCFDWGGVIVRICRSWREGCEAAGLDVRGNSTDPACAHERHALAVLYQNGELTTEAFLDQLAASTRGLYSREEVLAIHSAWLKHEYAGVDKVIERLNEMDEIETALLSNTNELHWRMHTAGGDGSPPAFPTAGTLTHKVASHIEGVSKPSHRMYLAMNELAGCEGQGILFFDDLADNIDAARAVGWRAEQIDPEGDTSAQIMRHLRAHDVL